MKPQEKIKMLLDALNDILNISEPDCQKYVAIADSIALDAVSKYEAEL